METKTNLETTNWAIISLLCILAGFVILSWNIYDHFNYILLDKAKLPEWKTPLLNWQICLSIFIPPIAGIFADYYSGRGKNYLFITLCMGITAMLFMTTAILTGDSIGSELQSVLPIMMILWMTGMHLFFSPAINLIKKSAKRAQLPIAVAMIFFVADIIYSLNKYIIHGVEQLGSVLIFAGAGLVLALLGFYYWKFSKNLPAYIPHDPIDSTFIWIARAIAVGLLGGLCKGLFKLDSLQKLSQYLPFTDIVSVIIFISAFVVFGMAFVLKNQSSTRIFFTGAILSIIGFSLTSIISGKFEAILSLNLIIIGISMVSLSIYSVALLRVPETKYNFAFGLFYAGYSLSAFVVKMILHS